MDQNALVKDGCSLVRYLDETEVRPKAAVWAHSPDTDTWKLWIVPHDPLSEPEFYNQVSRVLSDHRDEMQGLDISTVEQKKPDHPAIKGLGSIIRFEGLGPLQFSNNMLNGFYLPDGIVLRMAL